jgi:hypothetical protein
MGAKHNPPASATPRRDMSAAGVVPSRPSRSSTVGEVLRSSSRGSRNAMKRRPSDERTEVLRISVPHDAWVVFQSRAIRARAQHPEAKIPDGTRGTRLFLRAWIEAKLRAEI